MRVYWRNLRDHFVFFLVCIWVILNARREYLRLVKFQLPYLAFPVRLAVPKLANEKYLWRKMFDHNPTFVTVTDKIAAKQWVKAQGINVAMPQTLWVGTDASDIPPELWKQAAYLKAAHGCQMNIPLLQKPADPSAIISQANAFLQHDHGSRRRQWAYASVPRRLLLEQAVLTQGGLIEIKCFTYGDQVEQFLLIRRGPPESGTRWEKLPDGRFEKSLIQTTISDEAEPTPLPAVTDDALKIAAQIGAHFDHVRVDFMTDGDILFLGEITVYHDAGRAYRQGHYKEAPANRNWDLRKSWFLTTPQTGWRRIYAEALKRALDREWS